MAALKTAQEKAAVAFGAQHTYFSTNGTSTSNKIVVQALVEPGDLVLIDRDCHKSHHYGLVLAGALPVYLDSYPIPKYSMYGAVPLTTIKRKLLNLKKAGRLDKVKMLLLTNCTFDGLVYNVEMFMEEVLAIKPDIVFLWDEAWFAFAGFTYNFKQRTAMYVAKKLHDKYQSKYYRKQYDKHVAEIKLAGCTDWQPITLSPADFLDADGSALASWQDIKELRLGPSEYLTPKNGGKRRLVGSGKWQGAAPQFRNLRWLPTTP